MPAASRDAFFALRAFNVEVASIKDGHNLRKQGSSPPDQISTTSAMSSIFALQLRMQWWRNAIEAIFNEDNAQDGPANVVHHDIADNSSSQSTTTNAFVSNLATSCWNSPVVRALDRSNRNLQQRTNSGWTRRFLERLLDARETDLDIRQYESMDQCQQYADDTVSSLLYLTLETVQVRDDAADQAASHAGIGIGLTTLLRATPYRLLNGGEMPIPSQLLPSNFPYHQLLPTYLGGDTDRLNGDGSVDDIVLSESDSQNLLDAVRHMADTATDHLALARSLQSQVPSRGRCCLLPVIPSATYLSKLKQNEHNLFAAANSIGPTDRLSLLLRMARTWATGVL